MKFTVKIRDADALTETIDAVVEESTADIADDDEREAVMDVRRNKAFDFCAEYVDSGAYYFIEFDTIEKTARVVPRNKRGVP